MAVVLVMTPFAVWAQSVATDKENKPDVAVKRAVPHLLLAKNFHPGVVISDFWISEKLDGVRGYWNGKQLLTRAGYTIQAPPWFTVGWPRQAMDGELWLGRHRFEEMAAIVHTANPDDARWRNVTYQVFDLPHASGSFSERKQAIAKLLSGLRKSWVHAVPHYRLSSSDALQKNSMM